ncbi:MAG TPA: hypothetical protein VK604_12395 [Bryobacteraceae bacterium]|nr:hypothetical protein [Bryobacteraceae bacterium]
MQKRKKLAAVVTVYRKYSHAQHIVDRLLDGYGWNGAYHEPPFDPVSLYVDQVGADDLSRERAQRHPSMKIYPSIHEALTLGGTALAVDGVVLVGEHGNYPKNEKGQTRYPRHEFFQQIVEVFRSSKRAVPVFNDKHLSWNWAWAEEMYRTSRDFPFPLQAGSSLPVTWRIPSVEMPLGASVREALCVCYGGVDSYDFHGLETIQGMVERRKGGESGVRWIQAYRGDNFWKALGEGVWPADLLQAALCRSHTLTPARQGFNDMLPTVEQMRKLVEDPVAYTYEHHDGLRCTMLLMGGLVRDFNFAARLDNPSRIFSTQMYLPMPDGRTTLATFFSPLVFHMEQLFATGRTTYPIERTLLTTGLTASGVESLFQKETRIETPHLAIRYTAPRDSTFQRA